MRENIIPILATDLGEGYGNSVSRERTGRIEREDSAMRQKRRLRAPPRFGASSPTCALAVLIFGAGMNQPVQARIIKFDPPGSYQTTPLAINASGSITGQYSDDNRGHGFLRAPDGTITTIDVAGATCGTAPWGINRSGVVVGEADYHDGNYCNGHGFIRTPDGALTLFDAPGAASTAASSIDNEGFVTGSYLDSERQGHGYLRAPDGSFTSFDVGGSVNTSPISINNKGTVAGSYQDSSKAWHGFVRRANGKIISFDAPNATATFVASLNDSGEVAGHYTQGQSAYGFVRTTDGTITTFDPGDSNEVGTYSINKHSAVTGFYSTDRVHGFVRDSGGTITTFDPKRSAATFPTAINAKGAITGSFEDVNESDWHGFLRTR